MTEAEILDRLSWGWIGQSDRKMLERRLAELRGGRTSAPSASPSPPPRPSASRGGGVTAGTVELTRKPGRGFYAQCSIVPGKTFEAHWDTGADNCHLSHDIVRNHLGIRNPARELRRDHDTIIADGTKVPTAQQPIDWTVEGIIIPNVKTSIMHTANGSNLIGMSLISQLRVKHAGDRLLIYPPKA